MREGRRSVGLGAFVESQSASSFTRPREEFATLRIGAEVTVTFDAVSALINRETQPKASLRSGGSIITIPPAAAASVASEGEVEPET